MRFLLNSPDVANQILSSVRQTLRKSGFMFKDDYAKIITGKQEGVSAWITVNYLLGHLMYTKVTFTLISMPPITAQSTWNTWRNPFFHFHLGCSFWPGFCSHVCHFICDLPGEKVGIGKNPKPVQMRFGNRLNAFAFFPLPFSPGRCHSVTWWWHRARDIRSRCNTSLSTEKDRDEEVVQGLIDEKIVLLTNL